jgi:DNA-binding Lrp family transcriptional regulator
MAENLSQHRLETRKCPVCKKKKTYPARNETCSFECGRKAEAERRQPAPVEIADADLDAAVLEAVKKARGRATVRMVSEALNKSERTILDTVAKLRDAGHNVSVRSDGICDISGDVKPGNAVKIVHDISEYNSRVRRFGVTSDNHLGSKHERLDVLNALYDLYESEGITEVYNAGNWIEGEARFNKYDINVYGMDRQVDYWIENYPRRKGIVTRYVAGDDHEGWYQQREQVEIGKYAELRARAAGREDLIYLGYVEADIELKAERGSRILRVMHPGGGSAYALSYSMQKMVESFQGGEKPCIILAGHYHKFDYNYYREVFTVQTGCTCDQSIFMRKNKIQAHVGGSIVEFNQAPDGTINRFKVEWLPFYDRGFYAGKSRRF